MLELRGSEGIVVCTSMAGLSLRILHHQGRRRSCTSREKMGGWMDFKKTLSETQSCVVYPSSPTKSNRQQVPFNTSLDEVLQCCRFLIAVITAWEQLSSHYQTFLLGESSVLLINSHEVISLWKNLPGWFHTTEISSQVCSHTFRVRSSCVCLSQKWSPFLWEPEAGSAAAYCCGCALGPN